MQIEPYVPAPTETPKESISPEDESRDYNDTIGSDEETSDPMNRSGIKRKFNELNNNAGAQNESFHQLTIRNGKKCTDDHRMALAYVAVDAGITINRARVAFKSFSKYFLHKEYFLSVEDALKADPATSSNETPSKTPRTLEDYKIYKNVIASYNTIARTMLDLSILQERNTALALLEKDQKVKATVHYDTTSRQKLFGEQTSLIIEFSNGESFNLKPLPIARENKEFIVQFFLEELNRLAIASNSDKKTIWEKLDAIMTDSVGKNMKIGEEIALRLSKYWSSL